MVRIPRQVDAVLLVRWQRNLTEVAIFDLEIPLYPRSFYLEIYYPLIERGMHCFFFAHVYCAAPCSCYSRTVQQKSAGHLGVG